MPRMSEKLAFDYHRQCGISFKFDWVQIFIHNSMQSIFCGWDFSSQAKKMVHVVSNQVNLEFSSNNVVIRNEMIFFPRRSIARLLMSLQLIMQGKNCYLKEKTCVTARFFFPLHSFIILISQIHSIIKYGQVLFTKNERNLILEPGGRYLSLSFYLHLRAI